MVPVLSAQMPLNILGMNLLIITEIDEKEVRKAVDDLRKWMVVIGISTARFWTRLAKLVVNSAIKISRFYRTLLDDLPLSSTQAAAASGQISASIHSPAQEASEKDASFEKTPSMEEMSILTKKCS